jgi:hypothetical protein
LESPGKDEYAFRGVLAGQYRSLGKIGSEPESVRSLQPQNEGGLLEGGLLTKNRVFTNYDPGPRPPQGQSKPLHAQLLI